MLRRAAHWSLVLGAALCPACGSQDEPTPSPSPSPTPILITSCPQGNLTDIAIVQATGEQSSPKVALVKDGTAWVAWYSAEGGNINMRAQRLRRDGSPTFGSSGLLVSAQPLTGSPPDFSLAADDYGAAIVAVSDARNSDLDAYAYKLTPAGATAWAPDGVRLATLSGADRFPRVALLETGEIVFAWETFGAGAAQVALQRLSVDGRRLWGEGMVIQRSRTAWANWTWVAPSDDGAVIVVWAEAFGPQDASPMIYARKLDAQGQMAWLGDIVLAGSQINPYYDRPILEPDGVGGVFVAWPAVSEYYYVRRVLQHLTAGGQSIMPTGGEPASLSQTTHQLEPSLAYKNATGEIVIVWSDADGAHRNRAIRAQRMTPGGARLWGDLGIELMPVTPYIPDTPHLAGVRATADGAIVVYTEQIAPNASPRRVLGARLALVDAPSWSPVVLSRTVSDKGLPSLGGTPECGTWAVWQDKNADEGDIRGSFLPAR